MQDATIKDLDAFTKLSERCLGENVEVTLTKEERRAIIVFSNSLRKFLMPAELEKKNPYSRLNLEGPVYGPFYNTTGETNPELAEFKKDAGKQDTIILRFLFKNRGIWYTVLGLMRDCFMGEPPPYDQHIERMSAGRSFHTLKNDPNCPVEMSPEAYWYSLKHPKRSVHAWRYPPANNIGEQRKLW